MTARPPRFVLGSAAIVLAAFAVYLPSLRGGWLWDDTDYVVANPYLESAAGLADLWLTPGATPQYYPVTFTAFWLQHQLWGSNPLGYRVVNVALHGLCALLLWCALHLLRVRAAWVAAAMFAVHPVVVESTAWVAELKNVLSGALSLGSLLAYLRFRPLEADEATGARNPAASYALALLLFAAALLSKPAAVLLPVAIVVVVWWKRGRVRRDEITPVVPMLAMGVAMALVTMWAERELSGVGDAASGLSLVERTLVAGRALWFYAGKLAAPVDLIPVYARWQVDALDWTQYLYPIAAAAVAAALWSLRGRIGRGPLTALAVYALMLLPALGLVDIAYFRYSFVADHFQYHAAPVLLAVVAAGLAGALAKQRSRWLTVGTMAAVLAVLSVLSWRHAHVFVSEKARCAYTLEHNPTCWLAMNNLGEALAAEGEQQEAIRLYRDALRLRPDYPEAHNNLGVALATRHDVDGARAHLEEATRLRPGYAEAHNNLGALAAMTGDRLGAVRHFQRAVAIRPGYAKAHLGLGEALLALGRPDEAIGHLEAVLRLEPANPRARTDLARALQLSGGSHSFPTTR